MDSFSKYFEWKWVTNGYRKLGTCGGRVLRIKQQLRGDMTCVYIYVQRWRKRKNVLQTGQNKVNLTDNFNLYQTTPPTPPPSPEMSFLIHWVFISFVLSWILIAIVNCTNRVFLDLNKYILLFQHFNSFFSG